MRGECEAHSPCVTGGPWTSWRKGVGVSGWWRFGGGAIVHESRTIGPKRLGGKEVGDIRGGRPVEEGRVRGGLGVGWRVDGEGPQASARHHHQVRQAILMTRGSSLSSLGGPVQGAYRKQQVPGGGGVPR